MFGRWLGWLIFQSLGLIERKEALKVVAVGAVPAEAVFIEQPLDTTARANLIGNALGADRPAHLAVPAAAEDHSSPG